MSKTTTLTMVDGVRVVVPDVLDQITPYVLREQEDWFEDEIRFLRRLLQPGEQIIDVGANHGVYTLSMAKAVGPSGRVWAFEPATSTAQTLASSIEANGFRHVVLDRSALSNHSGSATLSLNSNSELNSLVSVGTAGGSSETVALTTLDACTQRFGWQHIDFLKIDAEGEEARILQGGRRFFDEFSPLVMYEIRAGHDLQIGLVQAFTGLGYRSYRLVPGLDLLAPFDPDARVDDFLLNLFACKTDRAHRLAEGGWLVDELAAPEMPGPGPSDWRDTLAELPYAKRLFGLWESTAAKGQSGEVCEALALHAQSRNRTRGAAQRLAALRRSFNLLSAAAGRPSGFLRLASLARVAAELGERTVAFGVLSKLCTDLQQRRDIGPAEPFLSPSARFDTVVPGDAVGQWVLAAAMEERERLGSHSSYFAGESSREQLKHMLALGFASDEMRRRLELLKIRFPAATAVAARRA